MSRARTALLGGGGLALAAAAVAAIVVVAAGRRDDADAERFLDEVHAICSDYGARLDAIPPPTDLTLAVDVHASLAAALPVLRDEADAVRAVPAPPAVAADLDEFFRLTDRSLAALEASLHAASRRALFPMATALWRFEELRDQAKVVAGRIGFDC